MIKRKINNDAPNSLMFNQPKFFIKQINFKWWNEIDFNHYISSEFAYSGERTVAIFKVTPRQPLVVTEAGELEAYETMYR